MKRFASIICALLFVMAAFSMVQFDLGAAPAQAASSRACPGAWTINSAVTIGPGDTCTVSSNILVTGTGDLTITKSTIKMNVASDGQYNITVQNGGHLHILQNSTLTSNDAVHTSYLKAWAGSTLEIRDSNIAFLGSLYPNVGLEIFTNNAVVHNNNITNGMIGIAVQDATATITYNRIIGMSNNGIDITNSNSYVANNTIKTSGGSGISVATGGASMMIYNNTLFNNKEGIRVYLNSQATIKGNYVDQNKNSGRDIIVDQSNPIIDGNDLKNANVGIHYIGQCGGTAKNNIIKFGDANQDVGIKVLAQSNPNIVNNTIDSWWKGMTVFGWSDPVVEKNTITGASVAGIYFQSGKGTFKNNTIRDNPNDAINMIMDTDAKFYDNHIYNNSNDGMHVDDSIVQVINNNISKNTISAIHLIGYSTGDIRDNLFTKNGFGIELEDTATAKLENNDFLNNIGRGVGVGTTNHVDWLVSTGATVRSNDINLAGNLTINGPLLIDDSTLFMHSTATQKFKIIANDQFVLNSSFIQAKDAAKPYSFQAYSDLSLINGGIKDVGYVFAGNGEDAGVYYKATVGTKKATITNSYISNGFYGLIADSGNVVLENCQITSNDMVGIRSSGTAHVTASNSSLQLNADKDLWLGGTSVIEMRNSTFNKNSVTFGDTTSTLHVSWFVTARVVWPDAQGQAGDPVEGATVLIKEKGGTTVDTKTTDTTGSIGPQLILKELTKTQTTQTDYSPYNISGSISPIVVGWKNVDIANPNERAVTIILGDLSPPTITVTAPKDNDVFNYINIEVSGTAADTESGIKLVQVSKDGGLSWVTAFGTTTWNITIVMPEGTYSIMARAVNKAEGKTTVTVSNILIDRTAPNISWISPANNTLLNKRNVTVAGTTEDNAHVHINTVEMNASATGSFSTNLALAEGPNTITITVQDRALNSKSSTRYVTVDSIAPFINIDGPLNRMTTAVQLDITGSTEIGAKVSANGGAVNVNPATGIFSYSVLLSDGVNTYRFEATDKASNKNATTVTITLDSKAPILTVIYPTDGSVTKNKTIRARAMTDPNDDGTIKGYINGMLVTVDTLGEFSSNVVLNEGDNQITFRAEDGAGNGKNATSRVTLDTALPEIKDLTPASGIEVPNTQTTIWIEGKTEPGATVDINGKIVKAGANGAFSTEIPLVVGLNTIKITVTDKAGNKTEKTITVTRKSTVKPPNGNHTNGNNTDGTDWGLALPIILIIIILVAVGGAAAAMMSRKSPPPPGGGRRREDPRGRPPGREDPYAKGGRGGDRSGSYPRSPGSSNYDERGGYDEGYGQSSDQEYSQDGYDQGQDGYQDGYGDQGTDQAQDPGYDESAGYDQGSAYGDDQYSDQGYDNARGKRY